jgi:hypothetical protein
MMMITLELDRILIIFLTSSAMVTGPRDIFVSPQCKTAASRPVHGETKGIPIQSGRVSTPVLAQGAFLVTLLLLHFKSRASFILIVDDMYINIF